VVSLYCTDEKGSDRASLPAGAATG
jgi:hypothetical protein